MMDSVFFGRWQWTLASFLAVAILVPSADACTVVRYRVGDQTIVARNHDWMFGEGLVLINPRGLIKRSLTPLKAAQWESKYGSVSLTQFGREIPFAGMNEAGLTVDLLELLEASFPTVESMAAGAKTVNVIQWVQYQLDTAASVNDVVASLDTVVPIPLLPTVERVHFFVADRTGDVAIIEFLDGKPVVHRGDSPTHCATANDIHATESAHFHNTSSSRYCVAVQSIDQISSIGDVDQATEKAFDVLGQVSQPRLTQWSLVYRPKEGLLIFQTDGVPGRRWIDLNQCDFSPGAPTLAIDVLTKKTGNLLDHLLPVTPADNERIVNHSMDQYLPVGIVRSGMKMMLLQYPSTIQTTAAAVAE